MSWEPIDDLPEETHPWDEPSVCDIEGHEYNFGICIECGEPAENYDGAPHTREEVTTGWEPPHWEMETAWAQKQELTR